MMKKEKARKNMTIHITTFEEMTRANIRAVVTDEIIKIFEPAIDRASEELAKRIMAVLPDHIDEGRNKEAQCR